MKNNKQVHFLKIGLFFLFVFAIDASQAFGQQMNFMTYNIRYSTESDGANRWSERKKNLCSVLSFHDIDVCGMQEVLYSQITDIEVILPEYSYVGKGRDDGIKAGEFSPIFYKREKFTLLESQTLWLSQTSNTPSKGWDAAYPRIVTWAKFKAKKGKKVFFVFNTHFDHKGEVARRESAKMLISLVKQIAPNTPAIIMGDFNSSPKEEPCQLLNEGFTNTLAICETPHFGPQSTFNGFESKEIEGREIDHIFVNTKKTKVQKHATITQTWGGRFASDHHAVMVALQITKF